MAHDSLTEIRDSLDDAVNAWEYAHHNPTIESVQAACREMMRVTDAIKKALDTLSNS